MLDKSESKFLSFAFIAVAAVILLAWFLNLYGLKGMPITALLLLFSISGLSVLMLDFAKERFNLGATGNLVALTCGLVLVSLGVAAASLKLPLGPVASTFAFLSALFFLFPPVLYIARKRIIEERA